MASAAQEAEEALRDPLRLPAPIYRALGERRRGIVGATPTGRVLFLVLTHRGGRVRVITARDATPREQRRYRRRGR